MGCSSYSELFSRAISGQASMKSKLWLCQDQEMDVTQQVRVERVDTEERL